LQDGSWVSSLPACLLFYQQCAKIQLVLSVSCCGPADSRTCVLMHKWLAGTSCQFWCWHLDWSQACTTPVGGYHLQNCRGASSKALHCHNTRMPLCFQARRV